MRTVGANINKKLAEKRLIVALGELLIDLIPNNDGMKIEDSGTVIKTASGSAGIFACAASRLGGKSGFIGKVGQDSLSKMAVETVKNEGVDLSNLVFSDEGQIGLAFLEYLSDGRNYQYYRRNSVGSTLTSSELNEEYIKKAYIVHFPGMLLELSNEMRETCYKLVEIAKENNVLISFDPNIRNELLADNDAKKRLVQMVKKADVVTPTLQEAQAITNKESLGDVIRALHEMGPKIIVITRDKDGAVLSHNGEVVIAEGIDEKPVDPTGAGDTLAAALCVGLEEGMSFEKLIEFCNCSGTAVIKHKGAIGLALPTREEIEKMMELDVCKVKKVALNEID